MRFVLYDDATMEPITVVSVRGLGERDIERLPGQCLRLAPMPIRDLSISDAAPPRIARQEMVEVRFERFFRKGVYSWMAFTREAELATLLEPSFLPGQRPTVRRLEEESEALCRLFTAALSRP